MAHHLRGDEFELQLGVGHLLVLTDKGPAERQRIRNNLTQGPNPDTHNVDVATLRIRSDHAGDRTTQRQLMHAPSPSPHLG
jgi:hypothetical protein